MTRCLGLGVVAALMMAGCSSHGGEPVRPATVAAPQRMASVGDRLKACAPERVEFQLLRRDAPERFLWRAAVTDTVAGHHHVLSTSTPGTPVVPSVSPATLTPWLSEVVDQLGEQVPGLMPLPGPRPAPLLPQIPATGVLVGYQGATRLGATFEAYCDGAYQGRGHVSSWGTDTVGLLDCAIGAPRESLGHLAAALCPPKSRGRS